MIEYRFTGSVRSYAEVPGGAKIMAVNGSVVMGLCENCGKPILEDQFCRVWMDDVLTCRDCERNERKGKP